MNCPFDGTALEQVKRQGVEIDWCPQCKGVWLERGELDKLIDLNSEAIGRHEEPERGDRYERPRENSPERAYQQGHRPKKRKGFLSEMFDFD
jgi:Zn-finger nucleic acid-binding protein